MTSEAPGGPPDKFLPVDENQQKLNDFFGGDLKGIRQCLALHTQLSQKQYGFNMYIYNIILLQRIPAMIY